MAHTYVITDSFYTPGSAPDPQVTIVGSVDNFPITGYCWLSAYNQAATIGVAALKNLAVSIMLPIWTAANPPTLQPPVGLLTGTFVQ